MRPTKKTASIRLAFWKHEKHPFPVEGAFCRYVGEQVRDYSRIDLDTLFRDSEHVRAKLFQRFAIDVFRRRLAISGLRVERSNCRASIKTAIRDN